MQQPLILVLLLVLASFCLSQQNPDVVTELPGYVGPALKQYSGYLTTDARNGRKLHYYFIESENSPSTDPVILWLNGGPGCSSMEGLFTINGPFYLQEDGKTILPNPHGWTKAANMIYLEAPAGVGYSYSDNPEDYKRWNDDNTAADNYEALKQFFMRYPQFQKNDFFISGESYAGHYIPTLALAIHEGNMQQPSVFINLKGMLVGNGVLDDKEDANSTPEFMLQHALISTAMYNATMRACQGNVYAHQREPECMQKLNDLLAMLNGFNTNFIYDTCTEFPEFMNKRDEIQSTKFRYGRHPLFSLFSRRTPTSARAVINPSGGDSYICMGDSAFEEFMNQESIKRSLHVNPSIQWSVCNKTVSDFYNMTYTTMLPQYAKLSQWYDILAYTGDCDIVVNSRGTVAGFEKMGRPVLDGWRQWRIGKQVAGMFIKTDVYTLITIRGAGHMVPKFKPAASLEFVKRFITKQCC